MKKAKKLMLKKVLEVIPTAPFHFDSTFYKPVHFPKNYEKGPIVSGLLDYWKSKKSE